MKKKWQDVGLVGLVGLWEYVKGRAQVKARVGRQRASKGLVGLWDYVIGRAQVIEYIGLLSVLSVFSHSASLPVHWFTGSLVHWFIGSWLPSFELPAFFEL